MKKFVLMILVLFSCKLNRNTLPVPEFTLLSLLSLLSNITISAASGLTTNESGGTATFSVSLKQKPSSDVTIALSSSDTSEGTVSTTSLVFTENNYAVPQTVTVTGVNDSILDGNISYNIVTAPAVSSDSVYDGMDAADVTVKNLDSPFLETWESYTLNAFPSAPWVDDRNDGTPDDISVVTNGTKTLKLGNNPSGTYDGIEDGLYVNLGNITPNYIKVRVYRGNNNSTLILFRDSSGTTAFGLNDDYTNTWGWPSGSLLAYASPNNCNPGILTVTQWYTAELKNINFSTHTYDYYLDGVLQCSGLGFLNNIQDISVLRLGVEYSNVTQTYLDDIEIRQY